MSEPKAIVTCERVDYSLKFPLGRMVMTPGVQAAVNPMRLMEIFRLHASGDWGMVDEHNRNANDWSLQNDARLLSVYLIDPRKPDGPKVWVITEADRSATTALLPEEY
jgi:hypothetical protein